MEERYPLLVAYRVVRVKYPIMGNVIHIHSTECLARAQCWLLAPTSSRAVPVGEPERC
jgi:hypothetical protein